MPSRQHMLKLQKSSLWREWKGGSKEREGYSKKESKEKEKGKKCLNEMIYIHRGL
jgi:hypothetical protein